MSERTLNVDQLLDAASDIVLSGGFQGSTIETLAKRAGVTPSEILALFDSLDDVYVSMLNREFSMMYSVILDNVERDPLGGLLSRLWFYTLSSVYERPLARALYTTDRSTLNAIMRHAHGFNYIPSVESRSVMIEEMQRAGTVRRDIDAPMLSNFLTTYAAGLALTAPHGDLDLMIRGVCELLRRGVDADVSDTEPGKRAYYDYATRLTMK